jgi:hypothetical protein
VIKQVDALSNRFIVMAVCGRVLLETVHGAAPDKIAPIPHGRLIVCRHSLNTFV